jgi:hypothetical protein
LLPRSTRALEALAPGASFSGDPDGHRQLGGDVVEFRMLL